MGRLIEDGTGREPYRDVLPLTHFEDRLNGSLDAITRDRHHQSVARYAFDLFIKAIHVLAASHLGKELG